jgi:hypothetical protein
MLKKINNHNRQKTYGEKLTKLINNRQCDLKTLFVTSLCKRTVYLHNTTVYTVF